MLDMKDYVHYQANLDIQKDCTKMKLVDTACTDQSDEPYLVEKWRSSLATTETSTSIGSSGKETHPVKVLPESIPANMLAGFEKQLLPASSQTSEPCQSGLRQNRKVAYQADYILKF